MTKAPAPSKMHLCRAFRCTAEIDRKKLFCEPHWGRLSRRMKELLAVSMERAEGAHAALVECIAFIRRVEGFKHV
jgi:hypothetical protein